MSARAWGRKMGGGVRVELPQSFSLGQCKEFWTMDGGDGCRAI